MIKILSLIFMIFDHVSYFFYPDQSYWMRSIGQIAFPLFCFQIVQGHKNTSDQQQYIINILLCAAITQPVYTLMFPDIIYFNDLFTLLFGLILIVLYDRYGLKSFLLLLPLIFLQIVSYYILLVFIIYFSRKNTEIFILLNILFYSFAFLMSPYIYTIAGIFYIFFILYELPKIKFNKYIFYFVYPAHLYLILFILKF